MALRKYIVIHWELRQIIESSTILETQMMVSILTNQSTPRGASTYWAVLRQVARRGGRIAGNARKEIEADTGKPVITKKNAVDFFRLISDVIGESDKDDKNRSLNRVNPSKD